jgi:PAS domain S-box-containing protein
VNKPSSSFLGSIQRQVVRLLITATIAILLPIPIILFDNYSDQQTNVDQVFHLRSANEAKEAMLIIDELLLQPVAPDSEQINTQLRTRSRVFQDELGQKIETLIQLQQTYQWPEAESLIASLQQKHAALSLPDTEIAPVITQRTRLEDLRFKLNQLSLLHQIEFSSLQADQIQRRSKVTWIFGPLALVLIFGVGLFFRQAWRSLNQEVEMREATEAALQASESLLRQSQQVALIGSWRMDLATGQITWSPEIYQLFEVDSQQLNISYELFLERVHPDDREFVNEAYQASVTNHDRFDVSHRLLLSAGHIKHIHELGETMYDQDSQPSYMIGIAQDITERKQIEEEREKLIRELEVKNAELERFTYTVSHDLKSPLVTIQGYLGLLNQDLSSGKPERVHSDMERISDATRKMEQLLKDLLELSRIGRVMNPSKKVPFEEVVRETLEIVHGQLEAHGVTVHTQSDLPFVYGDRQRLTEVLQNLLDNAAKYMGNQKEPLIEIGHSDGDAERGKAIFFVKDNGIGIAPQYYERIFGLFNKLDATTEGTGIGLALVKRIVEVHGGRVWVESDGVPGNGSAFYFTLPRG